MIESIYIHIPFCKKKCLYCDFNSFDNQNEKMEDYMNALCKEAEILVQKYHISKLKTIYIGGGTPSFVKAEGIEKLLRILPSAEEVTMEMNPCTVTEEKLQIYQKVGVNRVSIGLQTTNNAILKEIGRAHTFEEFQNAYQMVRKVGFHNVNVDLMFGLPHQTLEDLKQSIDYLISIQPEHVSCYSLILHRPIFENLPSEEEERKMYDYTKETLQNAGYEHYEISNFAQKGYESKHNLVYWNQEEYIGMGAGASSYVNNERYINEENIDEYIRKMNSQQNIRTIQEVQTIEDKVREYMILKLRLLNGVNFREANAIFHFDVKRKFELEISKLFQMGLLEWTAQENLRLTRKGLDFANVVWREFI